MHSKRTMAPTEKSLPSLFPKRGSGTELHCVALVRGTAAGDTGTEGAGLTPLETSPGANTHRMELRRSGGDPERLWALSFRAGVRGISRMMPILLKYSWTHNVVAELLETMGGSVNPLAQTSGPVVFFAFPMMPLTHQGPMSPNRENGPSSSTSVPSPFLASFSMCLIPCLGLCCPSPETPVTLPRMLNRTFYPGPRYGIPRDRLPLYRGLQLTLGN